MEEMNCQVLELLQVFVITPVMGEFHSPWYVQNCILFYKLEKKLERRWRILGYMVLAHQTERPLRWIGYNVGSLCELFSSLMGARPNV